MQIMEHTAVPGSVHAGYIKGFACKFARKSAYIRVLCERGLKLLVQNHGSPDTVEGIASCITCIYILRASFWQS